MATSPTQLTLRRLRDAGYLAAVVEKWNQHARIRQDLFGFADVIAARADKAGVLLVQTTTVSNQSKRLAKLLAIPAVAVVLQAQNRIQVHGWKKVLGRWTATVREVLMSDLEVRP